MITALVIDKNTLEALQRVASFPETWFDDPAPSEEIGISRKTVGSIGYLTSRSTPTNARLLVVDWSIHGPIMGLPPQLRSEALSRLMRAALSIFEQSIVIPPYWKQFHLGSLLSFQSNGRHTHETARIQMDCSPKGLPHVFAFGLDRTGSAQLSDARADYPLFQDAVSNHSKALTEPPQRSKSEDRTVAPLIDLTEPLAEPFTLGLTVEEWYQSKLTKAQIKFVEAPLEHSTRLRGPAGTGKTVSLVVKCLREIYKQAESGADFRVAFLTHSMATVEQIESMIMSMDDRQTLFGGLPHVSLTVSTLQSLANKAMSYDLHGLEPLSNDGLEGRQMQMELLGSVLRAFKKGDWIAFEKRCSDAFRRYIDSEEASPAHRFFVWELMNEFACVLDADGVRDSWERRAKYIDEKRKNWMMRLETKAEREVVLELYTRFRKELRDMNAIGTDQMIADYLGFLDSFRWDSIRRKEGFDTLFVDELHLFNRQERMVFRHLMREDSRPPSVFMAYDAKQSPRDTFVGMTERDETKFNFWRDAKLGNVEQIDLVDVFRYTPQIAQALEAIDRSFPGLDLEEEWPKYSGIARTGNGDTPTVTELEDLQQMYDFVFPRAASAARSQGKGKRIALLCLDSERFSAYLNAGQHKELFIPITSREEIRSLAYAGKRFVLSMPEYVAGLQFDTVFLVDVDQAAVPEGAFSAGARRRFVSQVYLGASRAERHLELFASRDRGGISDVLKHALTSRAVLRAAKEALKKI